MTRKSKAMIICFGIVINAVNIQAQSGTVSSGGDAAGTGGSMSYSIGQTYYETILGSTGSITQGLQQPFEISIVAGLQETGIQLSASVYPNPTAGKVTLNITDGKIEKVSYILSDVQGRILAKQNVVNPQTDILMEELVDGTYLIKVMSGQMVIKTYKIIKNN